MPDTHRSQAGPHFSKEELGHWPQTAIDMWNPMSSVLQLWNAQYTTTLTALGLEWSGFVARRMKEDVELPIRLAGARSPEEFWRQYSGFWLKMAHDYQEELDALARLGNERTQQSLDALKSVVAPEDREPERRSARH